jgi:hypothetical protein
MNVRLTLHYQIPPQGEQRELGAHPKKKGKSKKKGGKQHWGAHDTSY